MAKEGPSWILVAIIIAVVAIAINGGLPDFSGGKGTTDNSDTTSTTTVGGCNVEDINFSPKMTRMGKAGTSLSGVNSYNYYIITDNLGSYAGNAGATVPTNYDMQIMFAENTSSASPARYYTVVETINTDCQDPFYMNVEVPLADTSLNSFYIINSDGSVNSVNNNQSIGADEIMEMTATIKAGSDTYFGNPTSDCKNVGVIEYDKTHIRMVEGAEKIAVPGFFTYYNATFDGSNAFYIPKVGDGMEASFDFSIETTAAGLATSAPNTTYPKLHIYDCDIDKDEDDLSLIEGVEDEDLNSISQANATLSIYVQRA